MTLNLTMVEAEPVDLMQATEDLYRETAEELMRGLQLIRAGTFDKVTSVPAAVRDLKAAFQLVMEERTRFEKLRKQTAGAIGNGQLNFDAARDEIGRRLARLRDAGSGG